jgi:hypothetical protein
VATVKFHLANACDKLGARSRAQLAGLFRAAPQAVSSPGPSTEFAPAPKAEESAPDESPNPDRHRVVPYTAAYADAGERNSRRDQDAVPAGNDITADWDLLHVASAGLGRRWANR